ncbi:MAG: FecR domain-containing protein [Bacteroidales bacterium]|jgi:ferric-dicitrate binding protein FerR (iron transport regulator)|nr:FecR domain-containing protein [Bacteroidales bacterium]
MKEKTNKEELIDKELEILAPGVSDAEETDVDRAWNKVWSRMNEQATVISLKPDRQLFIRSRLIRVAAAILVLIGLGTTAIYIGNSDALIKTIIASTGDDQKNQAVSLPDGSSIILNRNTRLSYKSNFGKRSRQVSLSGEAFFEITADASKPFTIDAGKASVKVVGTSFNVITDNVDSAVEVFVTSGKVMLTDNSGIRDITLEPGDVGTMDSKHAQKTLNQNPNYMSWNTGKLNYDGQSLEIVFRDLKRVYNMDIKADDPAILSNRWTSPIDIQSRDTIIRLICTSFNLSYTKDGNVYHLSKE